MEQEQKFKTRRWLVWIGIGLALISIVWLYALSKPGANAIVCLITCAPTIADSPNEHLRILSLNMLHGYPDFKYLEQRTALLTQEISQLDADIVLLQEVPWTRTQGHFAEELAQQLQLNFAYLRANGNYTLIGFEEGSAIFSRYPLKNIIFAELRPSASFFENRIVLQATVESPRGNLDIFVTHLTNGERAINAAQTDSLLAFVQNEAQYPAIVAGDFNAVEDSPQIQSLTKLWQDGFRLIYPEAQGGTCCVSDLSDASATGMSNRIDYLFLVPTTEQRLTLVDIQRIFAEPVDVEEGHLWLSDHAGLLATISLEPAP